MAIMLSHGQKREDIEQGSERSVESTAKPEQLGGSQERSRVSADSAAGSEKVTHRLVLIEWVDSYGCSATWQKLDIETIRKNRSAAIAKGLPKSDYAPRLNNPIQ